MVPTSATIKGLFARSGNRCAFPGCDLPLVEKNDIVTGEICHIRSRGAGGPRYHPSQTDAARNDAANLILLCARHHKIVDDAPEVYTADNLCAMKKEREMPGIEVTPEIARRAELLLQKLIINVRGDLSATIHAHTFTINNAKRTNTKPVPTSDVVGGSSPHRTYLKYLIDRYQEFARAQKDREFKYPVVYQSIRNKFKANWDWVPLSCFQEVISFMQAKIDGTLIGRQHKKQGKLSYEDFERYKLAHR
jgi:hypothetical protein